MLAFLKATNAPLLSPRFNTMLDFLCTLQDSDSSTKENNTFPPDLAQIKEQADMPVDLTVIRASGLFKSTTETGLNMAS